MKQTSVRDTDDELTALLDPGKPGQMQVVVRALRVLFTVTQSDTPIGLATLAKELDTPRSTVYRIVDTLESTGLVTRVGDGVSPTPRLFLLTAGGKGTARLAAVAEPLLGGLVHETGETGGMQVRIGSLRRCVLEIDGLNGIRWSHGIGYTAPLWAGAIGYVLMAGMADEGIDEVLADVDVQSLASGAPADGHECRARIDAARSAGWSLTTSEVEEGATAVAAPIRSDGEVVAAINLFAPDNRSDALHDAVPRLLQVADRISQEWRRITDATI